MYSAITLFQKYSRVWHGDLKFVFQSTNRMMMKQIPWPCTGTYKSLWYELQKRIIHFSQSGMNEARIWPSQHRQKNDRFTNWSKATLLLKWHCAISAKEFDVHWLDSKHLLHKKAYFKYERNGDGERGKKGLVSAVIMYCLSTVWRGEGVK